MNGMDEPKISVTRLMEKFNMELLTKRINTDKVFITKAEINRPAFALMDFYNSFDASRPQIVGIVEDEYMDMKTNEEKHRIYEKLFKTGIPCMIFARGIEPDEIIIQRGDEQGVPILVSDRTTSDLTAEVIRFLKEELAPMISIHGVLVDVFGEGVLITGESGIGKSEAALELIKRGHRLVSDDVVELRKISDDILIGSAPEMTRHFIELRGIGIINVKALYGAECVKDAQQVDLVIKLEEWSKEKEYDRLGMFDEYAEYLGTKITSHSVPIRPGRNLAVIVESAAVNHRQKKMGYNAAQALYERVQKNLHSRMETGANARFSDDSKD